MTTMSFNAAQGQTYFAGNGSPRLSFAARLAVLQARQEQSPHLSSLFGVAARFGLAAVPVAAMAWLFVFV